MSEQRYETFEEFWPHYLREHANPANRRLHQMGTTAALTVFGVGLLTRRKWMMAVAPVFGYGPAWIGHFIIEKNRPATFTYPAWSLIGDFKMNALMWSGQLDAELERYGILEEPEDMQSTPRAAED